MGRPSTYTDERAALLCDHLVEGLSLRQASCLEGMPSRETVRRWLRDKPEFRARYARACEFRADALCDEMIEIADDSSNDWRPGRNGPTCNTENIQRAKLQIDARKWLIVRLAPKKYGTSKNWRER